MPSLGWSLSTSPRSTLFLFHLVIVSFVLPTGDPNKGLFRPSRLVSFRSQIMF